MMARRDNFDLNNYTFAPPKPGACAVCATVHDPAMPHDRNSLYYQMRFFQDHHRLPTWGDTIADCSPFRKAYWKMIMKNKGVKISEIVTDDR
jgi:hypothetical protein